MPRDGTRSDERAMGSGPRSRRKRSSWSSDSGGNSPRRPPPSSDSGSSIDSTADEREQRKRRARRREHLSTCTTDLFTPSEDRAIRESLRRKLLLNDGVRLSRVERRLSHADRRGDGLVGISAFKDAFATEETAVNRSSRVARDETSWLIENLRTRNGKKVAILEMRSLLQSGREELDNRGSSVDSFEGGQSRRRRRSWSHQPERDEQRRVTWRSASRIGRDLNNHSLDNRRRLDISSPLDPPAKWAIRHGSVGRWLHDVAAPLERKLFFDFVRSLEKFEHRNGLDHYRTRPEETRSSQATGDKNEGTTILHLGPMLKAAIRFYI